ncbi:hypothetical protein MN116_008748 [Schistosoma mekongi]|uniref:Large ribosomal subunit protein mL40 n=1 Tax=Schistosoma mekongi TaxID=38744 RepID=A0AAE1Z5A9_SCHME|nr:hypothetical protein MN116_008748 [Schistosoma mekongi]
MFVKLTSLFIQSVYTQPRIFFPLSELHLSPIVMAEPLKRKKRVDPASEQLRIGRKIRKIEKEIKRISRFDRQLRPVEDIEGDRQLLKEIKLRQRLPIDISETELDERVTIWKKWTHYQQNVAYREITKYKMAIAAQQHALDCLYKTSPDLYKEAIKPCPELVQCEPSEDLNSTVTRGNNYLTLVGPYIGAPKLNGELINSTAEYEPPDGEQQDTTPKLTYEFELHSQFIADPKKKKFLPPNK